MWPIMYMLWREWNLLWISEKKYRLIGKLIGSRIDLRVMFIMLAQLDWYVVALAAVKTNFALHFIKYQKRFQTMDYICITDKWPK